MKRMKNMCILKDWQRRQCQLCVYTHNTAPTKTEFCFSEFDVAKKPQFVQFTQLRLRMILFSAKPEPECTSLVLVLIVRLRHWQSVQHKHDMNVFAFYLFVDDSDRTHGPHAHTKRRIINLRKINAKHCTLCFPIQSVFVVQFFHSSLPFAQVL